MLKLYFEYIEDWELHMDSLAGKASPSVDLAWVHIKDTKCWVTLVTPLLRGQLALVVLEHWFPRRMEASQEEYEAWKSGTRARVTKKLAETGFTVRPGVLKLPG